MTADLPLARVYWTILGDASRAQEDRQGARARDRRFLRHLLAERLSLRRAPEVKFQFDESVAAQDRIEQIIQELHVERRRVPPTEDDLQR